MKESEPLLDVRCKGVHGEAFDAMGGKSGISTHPDRTSDVHWRKFLKYGLALILGIGSFLFIGFEFRGNPGFLALDFDLRYNEISCSHEGVNPFKIWSREISSDRYRGYQRPDKEEDAASGKLPVHSYPPWHTTFFWWYPSLSRAICAGAIRLLAISSWLFAVLAFSAKLPFRQVEDKVLACACGMMAFGYPLACHLNMGNYGGVELWMFLLMERSISKGRQFLAGAAWAVMMIKPQVAVLAFWPLLFSRQYKAILTAVSICLAASCWPAYVYGCSPLELIMQIPEIGAPYMAESWNRLMFEISLLPEINAAVMMRVSACAGFVFCAAASWRFKNCKSLLVRFLPFLFIFPEWTYGGVGDRVVQIPLYFTIAAMSARTIYAGNGGTSAKIAVLCLAGLTATESFHVIWNMLPEFGICHSGIGWIYRGVAQMATPAIRLVLFVVTWRLLPRYSDIENSGMRSKMLMAEP